MGSSGAWDYLIMKAREKGAITGFLLIPVLFLFCYPLMGIAAIFEAETLAG